MRAYVGGGTATPSLMTARLTQLMGNKVDEVKPQLDGDLDLALRILRVELKYDPPVDEAATLAEAVKVAANVLSHYDHQTRELIARFCASLQRAMNSEDSWWDILEREREDSGETQA
jgi:hypothetical protein